MEIIFFLILGIVVIGSIFFLILITKMHSKSPPELKFLKMEVKGAGGSDLSPQRMIVLVAISVVILLVLMFPLYSDIEIESSSQIIAGGALILILFGVGFFWLFLSTAAVDHIIASTEQQIRLLDGQIQKRGGKVSEGERIFPHNNYMPYVEFSVGSRDADNRYPPYTDYILKSLTQSKFSIYIARTSMVGQISEAIGFEDIKINNPNFDSIYTVKGNNAMMVQQFLTTELQQRFVSFQKFHPKLKIKGGELKLSIPFLLQNHHQYDQFFDLGCAILDKYQMLG